MRWSSLAILAVTLLAACQEADPGPGARPATIAAVVEATELDTGPLREALALLSGPEYAEDCRSPHHQLSVDWPVDATERQRWRDHAAEVRPAIDAALARNETGAAFVIAELGLHQYTPVLIDKLLAERHFYGWEGPDYDRRAAYLYDAQYPRQMAYICALEHLHARPIETIVSLNEAQRASLQREARKAAVRPGDIAETAPFAAAWLLATLEPVR